VHHLTGTTLLKTAHCSYCSGTRLHVDKIENLKHYELRVIKRKNRSAESWNTSNKVDLSKNKTVLVDRFRVRW